MGPMPHLVKLSYSTVANDSKSKLALKVPIMHALFTTEYIPLFHSTEPASDLLGDSKILPHLWVFADLHQKVLCSTM